MKKQDLSHFFHLISIFLIILAPSILGCSAKNNSKVYSSKTKVKPYSMDYDSKTEAQQNCDKWKKEGSIIKVDPNGSKSVWVPKSALYTRLCKENPLENEILGIDYSGELYNGMSWSLFKDTDYASHIGVAQDGYESLTDYADFGLVMGMTKTNGPKIIRIYSW